MSHGSETRNTKPVQIPELPSVGQVLLGDGIASRALCVIVADVMGFPLVIAVCLAEQGRVEVGLKGRVALGIAAHSGRGFTLVLQLALVHIIGHTYIDALDHLGLNAIDVQEAGTGCCWVLDWMLLDYTCKSKSPTVHGCHRPVGKATGAAGTHCVLDQMHTGKQIHMQAAQVADTAGSSSDATPGCLISCGCVCCVLCLLQLPRQLCLLLLLPLQPSMGVSVGR